MTRFYVYLHTFDYKHFISKIRLLSLLLAVVLQFFVFNVDYSRTEKVQFEDDEYYYYVKAVPKIVVARPEKKVKQINSQKTKAAPRTRTTH